MGRAKGFTLLEILLTVTIIGIIAGISLPLMQSFQNKNDSDIAANILAESWRRAQLLSQAVDGDASWGVKVQSGSITLFKGASYVARDAAWDEDFQISSSLLIGGTILNGEVVFTKFTGLPGVTGTIIFTTLNNETKTVTLNAKGMVEY